MPVTSQSRCAATPSRASSSLSARRRWKTERSRSRPAGLPSSTTPSRPRKQAASMAAEAARDERLDAFAARDHGARLFLVFVRVAERPVRRASICGGPRRCRSAGHRRARFRVHRREDPSGGRRTRSVRARRRTVRGRSGSERLKRIGQGGVDLGGAVRNRMADDCRRIIRSRGDDPCRSTCGVAQIVDGGFPARDGVRAAWIRRTVAIMEVVVTSRSSEFTSYTGSLTISLSAEAP
jgi:hypothetical protein